MSDVIQFPDKDAAMNEKHPGIIELGTDEHVGDLTVLIRENGPLTLAKLARYVWTNQNHRITQADRVALKEFLVMHEDVGGWENPKGQTWQIEGYVPPTQGTLDAPGMRRRLDTHPELEPLVQALSLARLQRLKLQKEESQAQDALVAKQRDLEILEYQYEDHDGELRTATAAPGKWKVTIPKVKMDE